MKTKSFFALVALSVVFTNCTREEIAAPVNESFRLTAIMEGDDASTRASVTEEGFFAWAENDAISVFTSDGNKVKGTLYSGAGESTATFQYTLIGDVTATGYAVYPHHSAHSIDNNALSVNLPSSYALGDAMDNTNAIMAAVPAASAAEDASQSQYSFKHLGGVFRFVFRNVPAGVDNFVLSLGGNKISGVFTSDLSADEPVIVTSATDTDSEKSVTLTFTALAEAADLTLYVPVPTGSYTGLSASLNAGSESKWSYSSDNASNTISRRSLKLMPTITIQTATGDIESSVSSAKTLQEALNKGGKVVLDAAIEVTETLTVPEGVTVELDLNGKALTASAATYVLNNRGNLTLTDSKGTGSVSARGIYNGYDAAGEYVTEAKIVIESGTYNALGANGGAAVYNYGIADINGGKFTATASYALNTQAGSEMTVDDAVIEVGGIYCMGTLTVGGETTLSNTLSGRHGIYAYDATVTIDGGTFTSTANNAVIMAAGSTVYTINAGEFSIETASYLLDGAKYIINGGTFNGGFRSSDMTVTGGNFNNDNGSGYSVSSATVSGGTYDASAKDLFASKHIAEGYAISEIEGAEGMYAVMPSDLTYVADGIGKNSEGEYILMNATGLSSLATLTNSGETFKGQTVKLDSDVDLSGVEWTPIGNSTNKFEGTFDGQDHTVSNLSISSTDSYVGLFGYTVNGEIKNLTVHNAKIEGRLGVGVVSGCPYTSDYTNITLTGLVQIDACFYVGAVVGRNAYGNLTDITVNVDEGSYVKANSVEGGTAYATYVGGVVGFMGEGSHTVKNVTSNIDVFGSTCYVGGISGIAHYGNTFENVSCSADVTITDAGDGTDEYYIGGVAGTWHAGGSNVVMNECAYTGKLSSTHADGSAVTDFRYDGLVGKVWGSGGSGLLLIDGKDADLVEVSTGAALASALESGGAVKLTAPVTLDSETSFSIPEGTVASLDLNGQTLTIDAEGSSSELYFENRGELVISGGKIEAGNSENSRKCIYNYGTMTIDGVEFSQTYESKGAAINNTGVMIIEDATVNAEAMAIWSSGSGAELTINGGTFNNDGIYDGGYIYGIQTLNGAKTTINGGTFTSNRGVVYLSGSGSKVEINDGVFTASSGDITGYCVYVGSGCEAVVNSGKFAVNGNETITFGSAGNLYIYGGMCQSIAGNRGITNTVTWVDSGNADYPYAPAL